MKVTAVLVPSLEEQREAGGYYPGVFLDPAGVRIDRARPLLVYLNGDVRLLPIGRAENLRVEDGRLIADLDIGKLVEGSSFSIAGMVRGEVMAARNERVVSDLDPVQVDVHWNKPPAEPKP